MAVLLLSLGTAFADRIECKSDVFCEGTRRADVIVGTQTGDNVDAKRGGDLIRGRRGDDNALRGGRGRDTIRGGIGRDHLVGGRGNDALQGGADFDAYVFGNNWGKEEIVDTPIVDADLNTAHEIRFDSVTTGLVITMTSGPGPEARTLDDGSTLDWDDDLIDRVLDGAGTDSITGRSVGDNIQLVANVSSGAGAGGADTVQSGGGDDFVVVVDGEPDDAVSCGAGTNDEVRADIGDSIDTTDCEDIDAF